MRARTAPVALLTLVAALAAAAPAPAAPGVPCSFYGMNPGALVSQGQVLLDAAYAGKIAESGARAVRIDFRLDGAAAWDAAKLAEYDGIVDAVLGAGLTPLGLFAYEAVEGGQIDWNDDPDLDGYNDYVEAFAGASQVVMDHFAGRIRRWEIWSEPNCWTNPDYDIDPQNAGCTYILPRVYSKALAEVLLRNQPLIKSGGLSLVSGGLRADDLGGLFSTGSDYLGEVYADGVWDVLEATAGRRYAWDALGVHLYLDQDTFADSQKTTAYLKDVRDLATQNGDASPFSLTEIGWSTLNVGEDVQASNLTAVMTQLSDRSDVADAHWFSYQDEPAADLYYGLVTESGQPKVALGAMQAVSADCVSDGEGGGGGGGASSAGSGSLGTGPTRGGEYGPLRSDRRESSCSCAAVGAETSDHWAWVFLIGVAARARRKIVQGPTR